MSTKETPQFTQPSLFEDAAPSHAERLKDEIAVAHNSALRAGRIGVRVTRAVLAGEIDSSEVNDVFTAVRDRRAENTVTYEEPPEDPFAEVTDTAPVADAPPTWSPSGILDQMAARGQLDREPDYRERAAGDHRD